MFNRIFNKSGAKDQAKSRESGLSAAPASSLDKAATQVDPAPYFDLTVDETILALDAELSGLGQIQVAQAAKERGWATLHRELERHPVRAASPALLKGTGAKGSLRGGSPQPVVAGHSRGWRVALGSAGVVVAIMAVLLGTYSAGLFGGGEGEGPGGTYASVTTTDVSEPDTTVATGDTTPTTVDPGTTSTTGINPTTTGTTENTPTTGSTPGTTQGTTPATDSTPGTTQGTTSTTKPAQTTTTNEQQMVAAEREKDAKNAAVQLGDAVLDHFLKGELGGLPNMTDSARAWLTQLISSLDSPTGCQRVATKTNADGTVRVTLEFADIDDNPRFFITVRVDDGGATITAISAGS